MSYETRVGRGRDFGQLPPLKTSRIYWVRVLFSMLVKRI